MVCCQSVSVGEWELTPMYVGAALPLLKTSDTRCYFQEASVTIIYSKKNNNTIAGKRVSHEITLADLTPTYVRYVRGMLEPLCHP